MLNRTHLAITLCGILLLINSVQNKIIFVIVALIATYIPDIDTKNSKAGRHLILRPLQWIVKHRGMFHSFSFLLTITFVFILFLPKIALGFFLGYGLHLFADCFTIEGIRPFYPSKNVCSGKIRTGRKLDMAVLVVFVILDLLLFFIKFRSIF